MHDSSHSGPAWQYTRIETSKIVAFPSPESLPGASFQHRATSNRLTVFSPDGGNQDTGQAGVLFTTANYHGSDLRCLKQGNTFFLKSEEAHPLPGEEIEYAGIAHRIVAVCQMASLWEIRTRRIA